MDEFRKIIHIDMDAFYASAEQRDRACFCNVHFNYNSF